MRAAVYARYSSENQRPESIADQVASCRRLASERGFEVPDEHVYADEAASGALTDRSGLKALRAAAEQGQFQVVLVDDLSRLARNTLLMLSVLEEFRFNGVRVVSVADGLDTDVDDALFHQTVERRLDPGDRDGPAQWRTVRGNDHSLTVESEDSIRPPGQRRNHPALE